MTGVWLLHQEAYWTVQDSYLLNPVNYNSLALKAIPENRQKVKNLSLPLVGLFTEDQPARISQFSLTIKKKPDKNDIAGRQRQQKRERNVLLSRMAWINGDVFWA